MVFMGVIKLMVFMEVIEFIGLLLHFFKSHKICRISTSFVLLHIAFILLW